MTPCRISMCDSRRVLYFRNSVNRWRECGEHVRSPFKTVSANVLENHASDSRGGPVAPRPPLDLTTRVIRIT